MSAHTPGAIRSANGILNAMETAFGVNFGEKRQEYLTACASKIDRETAAPELLAFAKWAMGQMCGDSGTSESYWGQFKEFSEGQSAIAKAEGKT